MWDKLSIKDKAKIIKMGVANGIRDLDTIRDTYNNVYAEGGDTNLLNNQDFLNQFGIAYRTPEKIMDEKVPFNPNLSREDQLAEDINLMRWLNSSTSEGITKGSMMGGRGKILSDRYYNPLNPEQLKAYADEYATMQSQVSRKEEREVEKAQGDRYAEYTGNGMANLVTGGWFTPSQFIGAFAHNDDRPFMERWLAGNTGIVDEQFAKDHPYLSLLTNTAFDFASLKPLLHTYTGIRNFPKAARARIYEALHTSPYGYNSETMIDTARKFFKFGRYPEPAELGIKTERDPLLREAFKIPNYDPSTPLVKDPEGKNYHLKFYPSSWESVEDLNVPYDTQSKHMRNAIHPYMIDRNTNLTEIGKTSEGKLSMNPSIVDQMSAAIKEGERQARLNLLSEEDLKKLKELKETKDRLILPTEIGSNKVVKDPASMVGGNSRITVIPEGYMVEDNWDLHPGEYQKRLVKYLEKRNNSKLNNILLKAAKSNITKKISDKLSKINVVKVFGGQDVNVVNNYKLHSNGIFPTLELLDRPGNPVVSSLSTPYYYNANNYILPNFRSILNNYNTQNK